MGISDRLPGGRGSQRKGEGRRRRRCLYIMSSELRQLAQRRASAGNEALYWHLGAWVLLTCAAFAMVLYFAGNAGAQLLDDSSMQLNAGLQRVVSSAGAISRAALTAAKQRPVCGNGVCEASETMANCLADCPGVTTPPQCGEEPHSDPGGYAVLWGASHKKDSAADCCAACAAHAADPKNAKRPCNSWVFCHSKPQCWSLDTGNWHGFGECWLKWQADPAHPLYGQRGKFTEEFRYKHRNAHKTGRNPDGTPRNLSVPSHVPWTGGVMGAKVDLSVHWETGLEGMKSSLGESTVLWRAWESREQNLARGVKPESMGRTWGGK